MNPRKKRIAIFASGEGSNFEAIAEACRRGEIPAEVVLLVCDRPGAKVMSRARRLSIPAVEVAPAEFPTKEEYEKWVAAKLEEYNIDLICLAGYMRIVGPHLLALYDNRILNIHPSLLPAYKGKDAIRRAFDAGERDYGVTVHFIDASLDGGKIIKQKKIPYSGSDFEELEKMVHEVEHRLFPEAICQVIER